MELWDAIKTYVLGTIGEELSWGFFLLYFAFMMIVFKHLLLRVYGYRKKRDTEMTPKPEPPPPPEQEVVLEGKVINHMDPHVDPAVLAALLLKTRPMGCRYTIHPALEGNNDTVQR